MKILPVTNTPNRTSSKQALNPPAFCAAPNPNVVKHSGFIDWILKRKIAQGAFKFANDNPFGFNVVVLSIACMIFRPATVMAIPGQKKDDKQYLAMKSIIASAVATAGRLLFILPLGLAIKHAGKLAKEKSRLGFPKIETPEFDRFNFAINNGAAFLITIGTAAVMTKAIPKVMAKILPSPEQKKKMDSEKRANATSDKRGGAV